MSLRRLLALGRTLLPLRLLTPAAAARSHVTRPSLALLPARYRLYRRSLRGLAAQLHTAALRCSHLGARHGRNSAAFLAFSVGLVMIEEQLERERTSAEICSHIQGVFRQKEARARPERLASGHRLQDYVIGAQIGSGCNAAVYEAAPTGTTGPAHFPLALKMMWNLGVGSSSDSILRSMCMELVPAAPRALKEATPLSGTFGAFPARLRPHPNVIRVQRAFTAEVPLLPGACDLYPAALPPRLHPSGLGGDRTLFLVMKNYPCTLRQYLSERRASSEEACLLLLQLLEGVAHLCRQGVAHRDLKSDNVLLELDPKATPRLVIADFGCCLAEGLQLRFTSLWVSRGGNGSLMAPEVATAVPGPGVVIDYSKADVWAVGAITYELFGQPNPFYGGAGLESHTYRETDLPPLPDHAPAEVRLLTSRLLLRDASKRPSARVAANMLHLSLWGRSLSDVGGAGACQLTDWLMCRSAVGVFSEGGRVQTQLQRCFLANLELEELLAAARLLGHARAQPRPPQEP